MRPFTSTITFDEALRRLADAAAPLTRTEQVALADASGRVVAERITSALDVPPFPRAAMDGYAVRAADVSAASAAAPAALTLVGAVFTGEWPARAVGMGECMEIATGAPVPDGADAVVMVERTTQEPASEGAHIGGRILVHEPVAPGRNIGPRGSDIASGGTVLVPGAPLTPGRLGALAATGATHVTVYERPRVALFSTGNEVVAPGAPLRAGAIYDVNAATLPPVVHANGGLVVENRRIADDVAAIAAALDSDADLVVLTGGSSVGERDLVVDAIAAAGGHVIFHGIAVKPGKPTLLARIDAATSALDATDRPAPLRLVLGLPGNPASCLSNAYILLVPLLRRLARLPEHRPERRRARLARRVTSVVDRHQFYTVRLEGGVAHPAFKGSGDITSLSEADGYFEVPVGVDAVERDTEVEVILF